ncbi:hypothetical protein [Variovorax sp. GT1P44]|uniref:hypothetical protein n=1 Tax=Variovorax sp. GT1P44 TaxID=3443742 RepID=UPI003F44A325
MPTEKERRRSAVRSEMAAYQYVYDNFRYTDAQREQVIEFIGAAMKVIRGDAEFESLQRLFKLEEKSPAIVSSRAYRGGTRFDFDTYFLNDWTSIYMLGTTDARSRIEPYHLQMDFSPPIEIQRERLEQLLQLKVGPGWIPDGGNLQTPEVMLHGGGVRQPATFEYSILNPPHAPYTAHVKLSYLNGPDKNPLTTATLAHLEIRRDYLTPEEIRDRDHKKLGHLPTTGQRVPKRGKWLGVFADDALTASIPMERRICGFGEGQMFGPVWVWSDAARERVPVQAWWQWYAPDPHEEELERIFGRKRQG